MGAPPPPPPGVEPTAPFYFGEDANAFLDAFAVFGTPCRTAFESAPAVLADAVATPSAPLERAAGADVAPAPGE